MAANPIRLLSILDSGEAALGERVQAASRLAAWGRWVEPAPQNLSALAERLLAFWQDLCSQRQGDRALYHHRVRAAWACLILSPRLPEGPTVCRNCPRHDDVEGPDPNRDGKLLRGRFHFRFSSIYEFHRQYPVEGCGIRKDLISVVEPDGARTPLLVWCRQHRVLVFCGRCGLDVTFEVSRNCPWRQTPRLKKPRLKLVR